MRTPVAECAGCGAEIPYDVGERPGDGCYGEFLATDLGYCFRRTCWAHECVRRSRAKLENAKPYTPPVSDAEKLRGDSALTRAKSPSSDRANN